MGLAIVVNEFFMKCYRCNSWPCTCRDGITLVHGDCREVASQLRSEFIWECVLADPPYGETSIEWDQWPTGWVDAVEWTTPVEASFWCFGSARMFWKQAADFR